MNEPWNEVETESEDCDECFGRGWIIFFCDGDVDPIECECCKGTGNQDFDYESNHYDIRESEATGN